MASLTERPGKTGTSYKVRWREAGSRHRRTFRRTKQAEAWRRKAEDIEAAGKGVDDRVTVHQAVNMLLDSALGSDHRITARGRIRSGARPRRSRWMPHWRG